MSTLDAHSKDEFSEKNLAGLEGKERLDYLIQLSKKFHNSAPDKTIAYAKEAIELLRDNPDKATESNLLSKLGKAYYRKSKYSISLEHYLNALRGRDELGDRKGMGGIYFMIGKIHHKFSDYDQALDYYFKSLELSEEFDNRATKAECINNIGRIYKAIKDYERALNYYSQFLAISKESNDINGISIAYNNIGSVYRRTGELQKALLFYKRSLDIVLKLGDDLSISSTYNNIGLVYNELGQYATALTHYKNAWDISKKKDDPYGIAVAMVNVAAIYRKQNRLNLAIKTINQILELTRKNDFIEIKSDCSQELAFIYISQRNHKLADKYYREYRITRDEIFNNEVSSKVAEMLTRYQTAKMEKEIEILKKDQAIKDLQLKKKEFLKVVMIGGFVVLTVFILLLVNRYRIKARANQELTRANQELERANAEIKTLSGLVPICANCKSIRDDGGYWHQVEVYVEKHSQAEFSHSLCPNCIQKLYPDLVEKDSSLLDSQ
ncbi:MAG: tetratricopeptide repeat protein [bacterium]|nr:tetratricopeptide repeat protein [bacterium]